ncbi:MAG: hypothetical protein ACJ788_00045, partial [Ktedonobacteraceae bacterium]
ITEKGVTVREETKEPEEDTVYWWHLFCPLCRRGACVGDYGEVKGNHTVTEHEDGTISISPSLRCIAKDDEEDPCPAHYIIKQNQILHVEEGKIQV